MLYSIASTDGTRRRRIAVAALAALLILGAVTTYAVRSPHHGTAPSSSPESMPSTTGIGAFSAPSQTPPPLTPVVATSDPEMFARHVADALFDWDTNTLTIPGDLIERLTAVGDPTGVSSTGLVSDVTSYLPTSGAWTDLSQYETRQWIEITSIEVPSLWSTALRQAGPKGLLPGTTAYTIQGIRHRSGVWEDARVSTRHAVSFTAFVVCGPSYPRCHLLRLSRLDDPLG